MYQVQARVIYPSQDEWSERTEDRPTFYVDNQSTHEGAANVAVGILGLSKDETVLINFSVMRVVSWYGIDIRAADQRSKPLDELRIPVLYFEYKGGKVQKAGSSRDLDTHNERAEIVTAARERGLEVNERDILEIDGELTIDGMVPTEWIAQMSMD